MTKIIGRRTAVGFGIESTRGTGVAAEYFYPTLDRSFNPKTNKVVNTSSRGVIEDSDSADVAEIWSEGSIEAKLLAGGIGYILRSLFGTVSSATGSSGTALTYVHTFTLNQTAQHKSLTVSIDDPNADYLYPNAMMGNFELKAETGDFVKFTVDIMAKQGTTGTVTPAYITDYEFTSKDVTVKLATTSTGLAGASAIPVTSLTLTINPNIEREQAVGSTSPADILNKQFSVEAEMELVYNANTYRTLVENATTQAMLIDIKDTSTDIATGASTVNPEVKFTIYKCQVIDREISAANDDFIKETLKIKGFYNSSTGIAKMIDCVVTNKITNYTT